MLVIRYKFLFLLLLFFISFAYADNHKPIELDKLFEKLSKIDNSDQATLIEKKIWSVWNKHPTDNNLTDKLKLGTELMYEGSFQYALKVFNNVIKSDPSWSEAWNKRATLLFFMRDYQRSLNDIEKVLIIEPRHFGALSGRAQILIAQKEYEKAMIDLKKIKKIHPRIKSNYLILDLEKLIKGLSI